jgi:hypothetical protein
MTTASTLYENCKMTVGRYSTELSFCNVIFSTCMHIFSVDNLGLVVGYAYFNKFWDAACVHQSPSFSFTTRRHLTAKLQPPVAADSTVQLLQLHNVYKLIRSIWLVEWLQHTPCKREFPSFFTALGGFSYEKMKLVVGNIKTKSSLVHRSVCRCGLETVTGRRCPGGPGSLRLQCDAK